MRRRRLLGSVTAAVLLVIGTISAAPAHGRADLAAVRPATAKFHNLAVAEQHGYALLTDASGIACIDMPGMGGMGVHRARPDLVADGRLDARRPEALVHAPDGAGTLVLAALDCPVAGSNLQDMLDLYPLKRQLAALRRDQPIH